MGRHRSRTWPRPYPYLDRRHDSLLPSHGRKHTYLNREMPLEGGLYVWACTAFGDLGGFMTAWNLWFYGIAITATILYAIPAELSSLIGPSRRLALENHLALCVIVAVLSVAITAAASMSAALNSANGSITSAASPSLHRSHRAHPAAPLGAIPTHAQPDGPLPLQLPQPNMISLALFGQMLFGALCGLEYIAILAGESKDAARSIGQSVVFASPMICAMFIAGTSSVLAFSRGHIDYIAPIPQTLRYALGNNGFGNLVAMIAILCAAISPHRRSQLHLLTGVTRLPMASRLGPLAIPEWLRMPASPAPALTPTLVNSTAFTCVLVLLLLFLANVGVHAQDAFQVLSNAAITH